MIPLMGAGSITALCPGGMFLENKTTVNLAGATLVKDNAATADHGGGIYVSGGVLEVTAGSRVEGNACPLIGGGILGLQGARISIAGGAMVVGNWAKREGGGVALLGGDDGVGAAHLLVEDSTLEGNIAAYYSGGGISADRSNVELVNASLLGNFASYSGGGLISMLSSVSMSASLVQGNIALQGGGVSVYGSPNVTSVLQMSKTSVLDNKATNEGGGLMMGAYSQALLLDTSAPQHLSSTSSDDGEANSTTDAAAAIWGEAWCGSDASVCIGRNQADSAAAMSFYNSTGHILQGVVVAENFGGEESDPTSVMSLSGRTHVAVDGGHYRCNVGTGFHITDFSTVTMSDTLVTNHTALVGGALRIDDTSAAMVENCSFVSNVARQGGAVYASGNLSMGQSSFQNNTADWGGAMLLDLNQQTTNVSGSVFVGNVAGSSEDADSLYSAGNGGAMYLSTGINYSEGMIGRTHLRALSYHGNIAAKGGAVGFWHPHDLLANREPPLCIDCGPLDDSNVAAYGSPEGWATYALHLQVDQNQDAEASNLRTEHDIIVRIIDSNGEIVTSDSTSMVEIHFNKPEECTILEGDRTVQAVKGQARFSGDATGLIIKGNPGTACQVYFSSDFNGLYAADVESNITEVPLRYCETGEELKGESPWQYCVACKAGWLSLDNETTCVECEAALDCYGSEACPLKCPGRDEYVVCQGSYLAPQAQHCGDPKEGSTQCLLDRLYTCENSDACTTASGAETCDAEDPGNAGRVGRGTNAVAELQLCKDGQYAGNGAVMCGGTLPVICDNDHFHELGREECLKCGSREHVMLAA
ncbi:hypothetical protein CYMTET_34124, partial [Cymbomonas tetramitiformis]